MRPAPSGIAIHRAGRSHPAQPSSGAALVQQVAPCRALPFSIILPDVCPCWDSCMHALFMKGPECISSHCTQCMVQIREPMVAFVASLCNETKSRMSNTLDYQPKFEARDLGTDKLLHLISHSPPHEACYSRLSGLQVTMLLAAATLQPAYIQCKEHLL